MLGDLTINRTTFSFSVPIPKSEAREYKSHPELLVPEVLFRADLYGQKLDKVVFHGPKKEEVYVGLIGRYISFANGIVGDPKTGLEWRVGPDKDTNWNEARSWVQSLNLDGGGWRMPSTDELKALYIKGTGSRNMTPLLKTTGWYVWSGETKTRGSSDARYFSFNDGSRDWYPRGNSSNKRAFAVRSRGDG